MHSAASSGQSGDPLILTQTTMKQQIFIAALALATVCSFLECLKFQEQRRAAYRKKRRAKASKPTGVNVETIDL